MRLPRRKTSPRNDLDGSSDFGVPCVPSLGNGVARPIARESLTELLESLRCDASPDAGDDFYVDWSGIRTRIGMLPWAPDGLKGRTSHALPIPDDGYRSEDVEYASLATALNTAQRTFRIVEVGAGWAPWAVAGVVQARRRGLQPFGIAVEADQTRVKWALQHALDNDVSAELITGTPDEIAAALARPTDDVEMRVVWAAGWHTATTLQFPEIDESDMGAAIWTLPGTNVDYRGAHLTHRQVPAVTIATLVAGPVMTDLLHIDVQGVEFEMLEPMSGAIQENVRLMAIGTTNRLAEGQLQQHYLERGWGLLIDDPCKAQFVMTHPTLSGFTVQDGTQLWENPFVLDRTAV